MHKQSNKNFLSLLRSGLWSNPVSMNLSEQEWSDIYELAHYHSVEAVVFDAVAMMSDRCQPQYGLKIIWINETICLERWNRRMDGEISHFIRQMESLDIECRLLKGRAISACYINPNRRISGDVDIYFEGENFEKAIEWAKKWGMREILRQGEKHIVLYYHEILWEFHHTLIIFSLNVFNKRFKKMLLSASNFAPSILILDNSVIVKTFEPTFNVLYIFCHLFKHAVNGNIGLRHYCDLSRLIWKEREVIDWSRLENYLTLLSLKNFFLACGALMTEHLGLPKKCFLMELNSKDSKSGKLLLKSAMESGNFGAIRQKIGMPMLVRKIYNFAHILTVTIRFIKIAPLESPFNLFIRIKTFLFS